MSTVVERHRRFEIRRVEESSIRTGNVPRELYRTAHVAVGGAEFTVYNPEPVRFAAYQGGFNPVYGETVDVVRQRIDQHRYGGLTDAEIVRMERESEEEAFNPDDWR